MAFGGLELGHGLWRVLSCPLRATVILSIHLCGGGRGEVCYI